MSKDNQDISVEAPALVVVVEPVEKEADHSSVVVNTSMATFPVAESSVAPIAASSVEDSAHLESLAVTASVNDIVVAEHSALIDSGNESDEDTPRLSVSPTFFSDSASLLESRAKLQEDQKLMDIKRAEVEVKLAELPQAQGVVNDDQNEIRDLDVGMIEDADLLKDMGIYDQHEECVDLMGTENFPVNGDH